MNAIPLRRRSCSRRQLLTLGAGAFLGMMPTLFAKTHPTARRIQRRGRALGTNVTLTVLHADQALAERALASAFRCLDEIEDVLSLYRPHSQLSRLNACGSLSNPHMHLKRVVRRALHFSQVSEGAFDLTIQPLWELYQRSFDEQSAPPSPSALARARACVDWRCVHLSEEAISLEGKRRAITLNGIAQGYAADCVQAVLAEHGIVHALIDCGEFGAPGGRADGTPWKLGIQHPREPDAYIQLVPLKDRCLATSGDYASQFGEDRTVHHLLNPRCGRSAREMSSVSIAAPTAMDADALSTAFFVAGVDQGVRLLARHPNTDAFVVLQNGQTLATKGFPCF